MSKTKILKKILTKGSLEEYTKKKPKLAVELIKWFENKIPNIIKMLKEHKNEYEFSIRAFNQVAKTLNPKRKMGNLQLLNDITEDYFDKKIEEFTGFQSGILAEIFELEQLLSELPRDIETEGLVEKKGKKTKEKKSLENILDEEDQINEGEMINWEEDESLKNIDVEDFDLEDYFD